MVSCKKMKKLPKIINQEEFELLLKNAGKHCRQISPTRLKQYKLAMLLGFESGMRISEIVGFKPSGAEIWRVPPLEKEQVSDSSIKIISGKGGKDRIVSRPKRMNESSLKLLPLSIKRRSLQSFIYHLGRSVLHRDISFHTLRHGFGSHLAGLGVPLHIIQQQMGHSRLDTTGIYLHVNPKEAISKVQELF